MAVVHIPRIRGNFGGVVIPRALFDGANHGLGIFCGVQHPDPASVERDVRRLAKSNGVAFAGKLKLPGGTLLATEMPADPAKLFMQLGLRQGEVRDQVNAVNLRDPSEEDVVNRWRNFQQLNHRHLDSASVEEKAAFEMRSVEIGENGSGALVIETPFGRSFSQGGKHHAEWQTAQDGMRKNQGGRASLFLRAFEMSDWAFLARGLVGQLHRFPERPIGGRDLQNLLEIGKTPNGPDVSMDLLRELIEEQVAFVRAAGAVSGRDFAEAVSVGFPPHDTRDRTATRVINGQYSTPPAVAEVAAEFLKPNGRTIYEPTIGNGVLAAPSYAAGGLVYGVEIDAGRHGRVGAALPEARVMLGDATKPETSAIRSVLREDGLFDAVMANPPYAPKDEDLGPVSFDQFGFNLPVRKLDSHIAAGAVSRLREGGNAVLVMPANMMRPDEPTVESKRFQTMLNSVFNKVDSVVLDASLYRNMGSNFPVVVHFCEDRRRDGDALPVAEASRKVPDRMEVMGTFGAFYEFASEVIQESRIVVLPAEEANANKALFLGTDVTEEPAPEDEAGPPQPEAGNEAETGGRSEPAPEPIEPAQGEGPSEPGRVPGTARGPAGGERVSRPRAERPEVTSPEPAPADEPTPEDATPPVVDTDGELMPPSKMDVREWFVDDFSPDPFTVPYMPRSQKGQTLAVIERTMANETYTALRRVEEAVGMTVDEFVAQRMGVSNEEFMSDAVLFYPEQVDSLALSFHRRATGRATIIGDQMGVGKGIQLAAHAFSSISVEKRPVLFMTNRANLFSDLCIRDWKNASGRRFVDMVKDGDVRPFIFNTDGALRENEKVVFATSPEDRKTAQREGHMGDANLAMMTYSQVQNASGAWRHQAIKNWMSRAVEGGSKPVILLDEAHKAAGEESRTGMVIQDILAHAQRLDVEIIYSSATSLKSGRNLPVYTPALPDTGLSTSELLLAIEKMPLAMQEVLASEMARDGALIERKMSDAGVDRELVVLADIDPEKMARTRAMVDRSSELLRDLSDMGKVIADAAKAQAKRGFGGMVMAGSADKVKVETTSVASQLDSYSRYLMGAVKGQFVSELLQDAVARGNKPSVVLEYTADSVAEYVIGGQLGLMSSLPDGVVVAGHPNIGDVLKRFAEKALTFKAVDGMGNVHEMRVEGFDGWLDDFMATVDDSDLQELRVNVFDRTREAVEALGMTFEDITGRKYEFRTGEDGQVRAFNREKPLTLDAVARYNRGQTDVLGLNSGSATGVSAQASRANGPDVRRREMIKLAFQREITDERQVEGRVHRAGQIVPPRYTIPVTGFAPDDRIANLFNRANRSLTSSTSATRENRTNADHAVDILNPVGERAAAMVLKRNPMIAEMIEIDPQKSLDIARKLLGRSVMMPLAQQSAVLSDVDATFRVIADKMSAEGTNPLRLQFYDWEGDVETVEDLIPGDPGSQGVAGEALRLNRVTYEEKVESIPTRTVLSNITDTARRHEDRFENMHKSWEYDKVFDRGRLQFEHHLFASVTGRAKEGMRYLWPIPLPQEATEAILTAFDRDIMIEERKLKRPVNNDEFRAISESVGERIFGENSHHQPLNDYRARVGQNTQGEALKPSSVALGIRALFNRREQVQRLNKTLPLIEPGHLIALDARALNSMTAGVWGSAYQKLDYDQGLIPAIVTSARFAHDSPFSESKMQFSVFVPGSRYTERLTVSSLHSAMEASGAPDDMPIRPFREFLMMATKNAYPSGQKQATQSALKAIMGDEGYESFNAKSEQLQLQHAHDLNVVVSEGLHNKAPGVAMFTALADAMPQLSRKQERITLEGNLFAAMSAVSSSVANATTGEKVVYTDKNGTHRNAILLNNRSTDKLIENVRRKVAKRSVVHSALSSADAVSDYLRLTNAVEFGLHYYDDEGIKEVLDTLATFYPGIYENGSDIQPENFSEIMATIRGHMTTQESTFPSSVMSGGDAWRWATDLAQKAAVQTEKPRGYIPGIGGPVQLTVKVDEDVNSLGYRDAHLWTSFSTNALSAAVGDLDKSQALAMSLRRDEVILMLHKDNPAFKGPDGSTLEGMMGQRLYDGKLKSGLLAGEFKVSNKSHRDLVARALVDNGIGKVELLIGGALKEVQNGLTKEADQRKKAQLRGALAADALNQPTPVSDQPSAESSPSRPSYGGGIVGP